MRKSASATKTYEPTTTWAVKDLKVGDKLEGVYEAKEEFEYNGDHKIKYVIAANNGTKYGVFDSAVLHRLFSEIPVGSYVWIEFTGKTTSEKTGRPVNMFNVDYDDEYQN